jgi:hypothetical protein
MPSCPPTARRCVPGGVLAAALVRRVGLADRPARAALRTIPSRRRGRTSGRCRTRPGASPSRSGWRCRWRISRSGSHTSRRRPTRKMRPAAPPSGQPPSTHGRRPGGATGRLAPPTWWRAAVPRTWCRSSSNWRSDLLNFGASVPIWSLWRLLTHSSGAVGIRWAAAPRGWSSAARRPSRTATGSACATPTRSPPCGARRAGRQAPGPSRREGPSPNARRCVPWLSSAVHPAPSASDLWELASCPQGRHRREHRHIAGTVRPVPGLRRRRLPRPGHSAGGSAHSRMCRLRPPPGVGSLRRRRSPAPAARQAGIAILRCTA